MDLQKVTLPLLILDVEHNDQKTPLAHVLNQRDAGYEQPFILNSGDDTYDSPASSFHFRASRPDGQIIDVDNSNGDLVQKGDQNWLLNLPTGVTEVPGLVKCVIYVKDDGQVLASSQQIMYNIIPAFDIDDIKHISYVADLDNLKAKLTDLVGKAQEQITRLSGITAGDKQSAEQALKEELDKFSKQAGDWLDSEKANINKQIADIVKQSSGLDDAYKQAYKEEIDKLAGQTGKDYEAKLQAVIDKLNASKLASLQAINDDWTKQKGSLQTDIAGFKDDLTKQVKSITDAVKSLNTSDLPAIQAKIKGFNDALDKLTGQISAIKLDITGYAKTADVNKDLNTKADKASLTDYALKKDVPDVSGLETTTEHKADLDKINKTIDTKADKTDLSAYEKKVDHANDIKNVNETLETYALKKDVPSVAGLETATNHKTDVDALNKALANKADKTALDSYALKKDVPAAPDLTGYAKKSDLPTIPGLDGYAKTADVNKELDNKANKTDLAAYETSADHKSDVDKLNKALSNKADVSAIPALPDMSKYALKTDLKNVDLTGYLTKDDTTRLLGEKANESELSEYAKKSDLPPIPNLSIYAKVTDVANALNNKADKADLANYAKKTDTTAIPDTSNFVTNDTLNSELSGYALKSDVANNVKTITALSNIIDWRGQSEPLSLTPDGTGNLSIPGDGSAIFPAVLKEPESGRSSILFYEQKASKNDWFLHFGINSAGTAHFVARGHELAKEDDLDALTTRVAALEAKLNK